MKPVFLISHQRSGTTALRSVLSMHDRIDDCGEVFNLEGSRYLANYFHFLRLDDNRRLLEPGKSKARFLAYYEHVAGSLDKPVGILDAKYDSLRLFDPESHELDKAPKLFYLVNEINGSVIHLTRNPFHVYVSHQVAVLTGKFHVPHEGRAVDAELRIQIDIADLLFYVARRNRERESVDQFCRQCESRLTIDYREIFVTPEQIHLDRVYDFLGVAPGEAKPAIRKSISKPYSQLISNHAEVCQALAEAGLATLLDEV